MPLTLTVSTPPAEEPLTLQEVKDFLRVDGVDQDATIELLIAAARALVETRSHRQLMRATFKLQLDAFPHCDGVIKLPRPPAAAVTSIKYIDGAGVQQTLDSDRYRVDAASTPARITPAHGYTWPATRCITNAVEIVYVAGYADADAVPPQAKQALLLLVGHWYVNREAVITGTISGLIEMAFDALVWSIKVPYLGEVS